MTRAIPVFAFAIAAYVATSHRRTTRHNGAAFANADGSAAFLNIWRQLDDDAEVTVRIGGVGENDEAAEVWLRSVTESANGFFGMVALKPEGMRGVSPGQTIGFHLNQIRGWKISAHPALAANGRRNIGGDFESF